MKLKSFGVARRSTSKFKHVQAGNIWAFVHGKSELTYEEHNHVKRCTHCDAIFKYFAIYGSRAQVEQTVEHVGQAA